MGRVIKNTHRERALWKNAAESLGHGTVPKEKGHQNPSQEWRPAYSTD
jgi:hypothetical protein